MKMILCHILLLSVMTFEAAAVEQLSVYPPVPDMAPSEFYSFRVREVSSSQWLSPFAFITRCVDKATAQSNHYFEHLADWSNTYCNFEVANNALVEVEITRLDPLTGLPVAIQKAVAHPRRKVRSWRVENGKAYVIIDKPALFAVDIDGQMDEQNTGKGYNGPAIHTVTVFANPFITDKPKPTGSGVYAVNPGEIPPDAGAWSTLYFKPGVHDIGKSFRVHKSKNYYIPGDAMVHGTFNNDKDFSDGSNIRIFGHGTLSGERIPHPEDDLELLDAYHYKPIDISGAGNTRVEGITIADSASHTLMLIQGYSPSTPTDTRWVKIFTWRANGDGINPFGNGVIEDCFIRTQDDGCYVNGRGIRRTVYWHDYNGSAFVLSPVGNISNPNLVVEDCDVIYVRAGWDKWAGGRVFNMRAEGGGAGGSNVTFRNINVEDPRPTLQHYLMMTEGLPPYRDPNEKNGPGDQFGIRFQNITIAAPSVLGLRDTFWAYAEAQYRDMIFDNMTVAGQHYDNIDDFVHNPPYVHDFIFQNIVPETMTYLNTSGYGKWYVYGDWDRGVEPANNDIASHTAVAGVLTVDAPAYAGTLNIAHANTATISVQLGGKLTITNALSLGAAGSGKLNLLDGSLELKNISGTALSVGNGTIHIEKGKFLWAGNHISAIQALYAANKLTLARGQDAMLSSSATLIGQYGRSKLYADYNNANPGYTTVWVTYVTGQLVTLHVEIENYTAMSGIQTQTTSDTGGGLNMGWIDNGDWADYEINVPATGTYPVDFRVASASSGGTITMVVGGSTIGTVAVANTGGWQTWKTVSTMANFHTAGTQTLRLKFAGGTGSLYNVNWFKMTRSIPFLPGDLDGDARVDMVDYALLSADWQNGYTMTDLLEMAGDWLIH